MIYNTTYSSKEIRYQINSELGKPYGLVDVLKVGATDSGRMILLEASKGFVELIQQDLDDTNAIIELRPKGILVQIAQSNLQLSWAIPYHQLTIYKTEGFSLHSNGEFLRLEIDQEQDKNFIKKVQDQRIRYLEQYAFP